MKIDLGFCSTALYILSLIAILYTTRTLYQVIRNQGRLRCHACPYLLRTSRGSAVYLSRPMSRGRGTNRNA